MLNTGKSKNCVDEDDGWLPIDGWKNKKFDSELNDKSTGESFKNHWEKITGEDWPTYCSVEGCNKFATVGARLFNINKCVGEWIAPFCKECSSDYEKIFILKRDTIFVSINTK